MGNADGQNVQCRHCGKAEFSHIHCPGSQVCDFPNIPTVPYYYEPNCTLGMLGCNADDVHTECRFCGDFPYSAVACPEGAAAPPSVSCAFESEPDVPAYWEPGCVLGMLGC